MFVAVIISPKFFLRSDGGFSNQGVMGATIIQLMQSLPNLPAQVRCLFAKVTELERVLHTLPELHMYIAKLESRIDQLEKKPLPPTVSTAPPPTPSSTPTSIPITRLPNDAVTKDGYDVTMHTEVIKAFDAFHMKLAEILQCGNQRQPKSQLLQDAKKYAASDIAKALVNGHTTPVDGYQWPPNFTRDDLQLFVELLNQELRKPRRR